MKAKLLLDEDVHFGLASALRKRGYDVIHTQELDRKGQSDLNQLLFARQEARCLFTFNVKDFVILHNEFAKSGSEHWGIIVSKQLPFAMTIAKLLNLLQHVSQESLKNRLAFL